MRTLEMAEVPAPVVESEIKNFEIIVGIGWE
jgi:hypothetical protein